MAHYLVTDTDLAAVADAIRAKGGTNGQLSFPSGFADAIDNIVTGGGGITTLEVIQELTLTENTRAVKVDIPSGYDWVYMLVKGQFVSSNWLYWGLNTTSGSNYQAETTALQTGFCATNATSDGNGRMFGIGHGGTSYTQSASDPMSYLHIRGYNKDIKAGTKIFTYGGKYANL